jgi:prolyl-tRNA synthetase
MTWVLTHQQAHSGIFQLLPLGLRVQDKIEKLVDKHMHSVGQYDSSNLAYVIKKLSLGASRLSLSTISSEELWRKSERLESVAPEVRAWSFDEAVWADSFSFSDSKIVKILR